MAGTLWLLPVGLGDAAWTTWLPGSVQARACTLTRFIAENARSARAALKAIGHPGPLQTLVIEEIPRVPAAADIDRLLEPLAAGADIGLLSEAGCPAVADPGAAYVRRAHERGFTVRPLVGPSALLLTLMASGLDGQRFAFHGYLPPADPARSQRLRELEMESADRQQTQLFIETPYRNAALFAALLRHCEPSTRLCVATDLTTDTETVRTRRIVEWAASPPPDLDRRPTVFALLAERAQQVKRGKPGADGRQRAAPPRRHRHRDQT